MALLTGSRHILRYVLAAVVFLFLLYLNLAQTSGSSRTSRHRHLKDPVQELKDAGTYVRPAHPEPPQQQAWKDANNEEVLATGVKQVGMKEAVALGEAPSRTNTADPTATHATADQEVDQEVLSKISSLESERSATGSTTSSYATHAGYEYTTGVDTSTHAISHPSTDASPTTHAAPHTTTRKPTTHTRPSPTISPSLHSSAHLLPSADAFLPHFSALPSLPNLTVPSAAESCTWPSTLPVNFQFGADAEWAVNPRNGSDIAHHRENWQRFILSDAIPYSAVADRFEGRGIVVVAGNERSLKRTFVLLRMLAHLKTSLPVEIHHHGLEELSGTNKTALSNVFPDISFSDLADPDQPVSTNAEGIINYNLKTAALLNSRFAEPLLLDSDNLPVSDPGVLFHSRTYKEFGTVFWPDIARTRPENPIWALSSTECRMDEYEQESGQLLVNKEKFWYHLQLAKFWADQEYYKEFLLGDKDTFRFAWRALRTEYGRPKRWLSSVGMVQRPRDESAWPDAAEVRKGVSSGSEMALARESGEVRERNQGEGLYCGHSFGQHHPDAVDSPILFLHGGLVKTLTLQQIMHARKYGRGLFSAYKESEKSADWREVEKVQIKWDAGTYLEGEARETQRHVAHCTDMDDVDVGVVGDGATSELEGFEDIAEEVGFYWMVNGNEED